MKKTLIYIAITIIILLGIYFFTSGSSSSQDNQTSVPSRESQASVKEFTVSAENYSFTPSAITVNKGDTVKINLDNIEGYHNLIIDEFGVGTKTVDGGQQDSIEFTADKAGDFIYYCSVGNHRALGMWGTLTVK